MVIVNSQDAADRILGSQESRRGFVEQDALRLTGFVASVETLAREDLDAHDAQEIRADVEALCPDGFLSELDRFRVITAIAGGGRGAGDSLYPSRPGIDLPGEPLNLQRAGIAFAVNQHHPVAVEPQVLGLHEVELPLHGDRHHDEEGRKGELQDDQTAADVTAAELGGFSGKSPDRVKSRDDLGRIQAGEYADHQGQGQGAYSSLGGQPLELELLMHDFVESGQGHFGQGHAPRDGDQADDDGLGEELVGKLGAGCADCLAQADLEGCGPWRGPGRD